jgi:hypothetical protein
MSGRQEKMAKIKAKREICGDCEHIEDGLPLCFARWFDGFDPEVLETRKINGKWQPLKPWWCRKGR